MHSSLPLLEEKSASWPYGDGEWVTEITCAVIQKRISLIAKYSVHKLDTKKAGPKMITSQPQTCGERIPEIPKPKEENMAKQAANTGSHLADFNFRYSKRDNIGISFLSRFISDYLYNHPTHQLPRCKTQRWLNLPVRWLHA